MFPCCTQKVVVTSNSKFNGSAYKFFLEVLLLYRCYLCEKSEAAASPSILLGMCNLLQICIHLNSLQHNLSRLIYLRFKRTIRMILYFYLSDIGTSRKFPYERFHRKFAKYLYVPMVLKYIQRKQNELSRVLL